MTQTTSRAAAPQAVVAAPPGGAVLSVRAGTRGPLAAVRTSLEGTPGRLRLAAAGAVLACLVFALLGGSAFQAWGGALDDARGDASQLVRVQTIQNDLVSADANATNEYLATGDAGAHQRAEYRKSVAQASQLLAAAAAANPADAQQLATANDALSRYTGLIEQARANNRQGQLVGTAYLRQAGTQVLRGQIIPVLDQVSQANRQRVSDAYGSVNAATTRLVVAGIVVLGGLVLVQLWLARRTHRVVNAPLAVASVAVVVGLVAGAVVVSSSATRATDVARHAYAATSALAGARAAAFDAKAQESLTLIARGNGAAYEATYKKDLATAQARLAAAAAAGATGDAADRLKAWDTVHAAIRTADDGGNWPGAVNLAIDQGLASGVTSSNTAFQAFDTASGQALSTQAAAVDDGLSRSHLLLVVLGWLTLALGLVAAGAAWAGISQRLEEYR